MSVNINSISDSYNAWYNVYYGGNTRGISPSELAQIEDRWSSNISTWKAQAAKDQNDYVISDDEYSSSKADGKQNAKDTTGCSGKKGGMIVRGAVDGALGATGAIAQAATNKAIKKAGEEAAKKTTEEAGKQAAKETAEKAGEEAAKKTTEEAGKQAAKETAKKDAQKTISKKCWMYTAPLALATGLLYKSNKPNEEEHEASVMLRDELLPEAQGELSEAQNAMDEATESVAELTEEANAANEDTNEEIKENKAEFDVFRTSAEDLQAKAKSGEQLTDAEKEFLAEVKPVLQDLGDNIEEIADENSDYVNDLHDDIGEYQGDFDDAAETIAEVEGLTDYAAGFDSTAETMCYVETVAQGMNAYSGIEAGVDATKFAISNWTHIWALAFVGMGFTGAYWSGKGALEQASWAKDIGEEIDLREMTQDFGSATLESYDEQIEMYDDNLAIVEDLEMDMPDDLEIPEDLAVQEDDPTTVPVATTTGTTQADNDKKDDDKEK